MSYCTHSKENKTSKCSGVLQGSVPGPVVLFIMFFRLSIVLSRGLHPKTVLDSGFRNSLWNLDSGFQLLAGFPIHGAGFHIIQSPGFWMAEAKISRIPDSKSKNFLDSGFYKQKFSGFGIPQAEIYWIPEFTVKNFHDCAIWITLHRANSQI